MAYLLDGGLVLIQMVKYYSFQLKTAIAIILDSKIHKIQNHEHILVPGVRINGVPLNLNFIASQPINKDQPSA